MKSKKAQGLSMSTIVIAAIALIVLVVLSAVFLGRMGRNVSELDACPGHCVDEKAGCTGYGRVTDNYNCDMDGNDKAGIGVDDEGNNNGYCCISVN